MYAVLVAYLDSACGALLRILLSKLARGEEIEYDNFVFTNIKNNFLNMEKETSFNHRIRCVPFQRPNGSEIQKDVEL